MTILIAVGNTLRRDDGIAHRVLELLAPLPAGVTAKSVQQLAPELAEYIAGARRVLVLDADVEASGFALARMAADDAPPRGALGHVVPAAEVISLARMLYGFTGEAWVGRLPVSDLSHGDVLSPEAHGAAKAAAMRIRDWLLKDT
jgi:hydrogenase maturation protease